MPQDVWNRFGLNHTIQVPRLSRKARGRSSWVAVGQVPGFTKGRSKSDWRNVIRGLVLPELHVADPESFSRYGRNRRDRCVSGRLGSQYVVVARVRPPATF